MFKKRNMFNTYKKKFFVAGTSLAFAVIVFAQQSDQAQAATCQYPGQVLDLSNWKQTLPKGKSESPTEIKQPSLQTYSDTFFSTSGDCQAVVFRAPVNGVSTSGSGYPRSELREMSAGGKSLASWSTTSGIHSMFIDEAITAVPQNKKHVVAGQIHDKSDDVIVLRLEYPKLFVDINGKPGPVLDAHYTLGKRFTAQFIAHNGVIDVYYNGSATPVYTLKKKGDGNYFKAGAYTQSNCSKEKSCSNENFGEVKIYRLSVNHTSKDIASLLAANKETVAVEVKNVAVPEAKTEAPNVEPTQTIESQVPKEEPMREPVVQKVEAEQETKTAVEPASKSWLEKFKVWMRSFTLFL